MNKKVLIVATVVKTHIMHFHIPTLKMFKEMGWETTVVARNDYENSGECEIPFCDNYINLPFERSPFSPKNFAVFKKLKNIIKENNFDIIHCHTPVGGVLARLAARSSRKNGARVFYTAHGFHFFSGAPLKNWFFYYPVEKLCARFTDVLITINSEDYNRAKKSFGAKETVLINGVGVSVNDMANTVVCQEELRQELGLKPENIVLLSVGELRELKNHKVIISAMSKIKNNNIHYIIAGSGEYEKELLKTAKENNLENHVHLLGYRKDIPKLIKISDIFCFASYREGLPLALMEAMAGGLPAVVSNIRGNKDLIDSESGGFLYEPDDSRGFSDGIRRLAESSELRKKFGCYNSEKIKKYDIDIISEELKKLYF